jgi:hypothetical protein
MTTVIIDTRSKEAKRLVDYLKTVKYVKVVENRDEKMGEYDPDFIKMLNERKKQPSIKLDVDNLWK